ncbi:MAG: AgmX/PglI C-terminal domain-containing protein [Sandaracinaceae bacterium]
MVYCQQCGAGNADDARFCNQCGQSIAAPGEEGGPLPTEPAAQTVAGHADAPASAPGREPSQKKSGGGEPNVWEMSEQPPSDGFDPTTMSLSAIGVRSRGKAWGVLLLVVSLLVGAGALGMWLIMGAEEEPASTVAEAEVPEPGEVTPEEIEVGEPVPEGDELPDVDYVPGTPRPSTRSASRSGRSTSRRGGASAGSGSTRGSTGGTGGGSTAGSSGGSTGGSGGSGGGSTGSSGGGSTAGGSGGGSAGGSTGGSTGGSGGSGGSGDRDWESMEEPADPVDFEMQMYSGRVRSVIREYYIRRASSCFEHASRNEQSVRGTVLIGFEIQADGNTRNASVDRNTTGIDSLGGCLARQVGSWRLPPPPEGRAPLAMQMPFSR